MKADICSKQLKKFVVQIIRNFSKIETPHQKSELTSLNALQTNNEDQRRSCAVKPSMVKLFLVNENSLSTIVFENESMSLRDLVD